MQSFSPRILLVYPFFSQDHLVNFSYMSPFYPGRHAVMPPLGLLTFAGCLPGEWDVRLVDENVRPVRKADLEWADIVALSGMHPQRERIHEILGQARELGKLTILGGPSASITPEFYPTADVLHVGEIGDGTGELVEWLREGPARPDQQQVFQNSEKTPLDEQPMPAWGLIDVNHYVAMPLQSSVGCPYQCEFCDIPVIYGRTPRWKSPERVLRELDAIYDTGFVGTISFVDDNLAANHKSLRELLPELVRWQKENRYPYPLSGEASMDLAEDTASLEQLEDARFTHLFVGLESLDTETLLSISKRHNTRRPMLESLRAFQNHGIEIMLGVILGFDTDTEQTGDRIREFIHEAQTPFVLFNLLAALPKTPLWHRLEREGRLLGHSKDEALRSDQLLTSLTTNIRYHLPNETVRQMLCDALVDIYRPDAVYGRYSWHAENVYPHQRFGRPPINSARQLMSVMLFSFGTLFRVLWRIGVRSDHRREFWDFARLLLKLRWQGKISSFLEAFLRAAPQAFHLITWAERTRQEHERRSGERTTGEGGAFYHSTRGTSEAREEEVISPQ
jgi:hopanoid C-2 methylase